MLKKIAFISIIGIQSSLFAQGIIHGGEIGNAADELKQIFRDLQKELVIKVNNLDSCMFEVETKPEIKKLIIDIKNELAFDIQNSQHIWKDNTQSNCTLTENRLNADITLDVKKCSENVFVRSSIMQELLKLSLTHLSEEHGQILQFELNEISQAILFAKPELCQNSSYKTTKLSGTHSIVCLLENDSVKCNKNNRTSKIEFTRPIWNAKHIGVTNIAICVSDSLGVTCNKQSNQIVREYFEKIESIDDLFFKQPIEIPRHCYRIKNQVKCSPIFLFEPEITYNIQGNQFSHFDYSNHNYESIQFLTSIKNDQATVHFFDQNPSSPQQSIILKHHPYILSHHNDDICVANDNGIDCYKAKYLDGLDFLNLLEKNKNLKFYPERIVMGNDYGCMVKDGKVRCWKHSATSEDELINLPINRITDQDEIAIFENKLCYVKSSNIKCLDLRP